MRVIGYISVFVIRTEMLATNYLLIYCTAMSKVRAR